MKNKKILFVGGTFAKTKGEARESSLVRKMVDAIEYPTTCYNGGLYEELEGILESAKEHDIVFWMPNVPNDLPKVRDVKAINPKAMLVTSKRNDGEKYAFGDLVQKALASKANLCFEFSKEADGFFNIRVFDPLGCVWADTQDVSVAVKMAMERLDYLSSVTRQGTVQKPCPEGILGLVADEQPFVDIVRHYASEFVKYMPAVKTERFVGNASFRCSNGMPSFRKDGQIFVSRRNIDKQGIGLDGFVPVWMEDGTLCYAGDHKPSVDTPVQLRLYDSLPNVQYILHSHCYIEDALYTSKAVPCGAIEEVDEVLRTLPHTDGSLYKINLKGHGSLVMSADLDGFEDIKYIARPIPEPATTQAKLRSIVRDLEERGFDVVVEADIHENKVDSLWYGGPIATVSNDRYAVEVTVYGEVRLYGSWKGEELEFVDKNNSGLFFDRYGHLFKDDAELYKAFDTGDLVYQNNNWVEVTVVDKATGRNVYCIPDYDTVIDGIASAPDVIAAFAAFDNAIAVFEEGEVFDDDI